MKDFYYVDILIWFGIPTILLFFLNLFYRFRKLHCSPKYYMFFLGVGSVGFSFGPSCMCQEIDQKALGLILFVIFVNAILIVVIICKLFFCKGIAGKPNSKG
jgi:hypothetical protein